ncbi:MAG: hypothetical protein V2J07_10665 [Anaerolineae bacterium]|nr:hypothetical protein [Anaerolineae bacterium]
MPDEEYGHIVAGVGILRAYFRNEIPGFLDRKRRSSRGDEARVDDLQLYPRFPCGNQAFSFAHRSTW